MLLDRLRSRPAPQTGRHGERVDGDGHVPAGPARSERADVRDGQPGLERTLHGDPRRAGVGSRAEVLHRSRTGHQDADRCPADRVASRSCRSLRSAFSSSSFWLVRFVVGVDINQVVQTAFSAAGLCSQHPAGHPGLCLPGDGSVVGRHQRRQRGRRDRGADLSPVSVGQRRGDGRRPAAAVCDGLRLLHDLRQRRRDGRHDRSGPGSGGTQPSRAFERSAGCRCRPRCSRSTSPSSSACRSC